MSSIMEVPRSFLLNSSIVFSRFPAPGGCVLISKLRRGWGREWIWGDLPWCGATWRGVMKTNYPQMTLKPKSKVSSEMTKTSLRYVMPADPSIRLVAR
jgi:hypothetical protein